MNPKELLKEASETIAGLSTEVANTRAKIYKLERELNLMKEPSEREILAKDLEIKSLVPLEKISALRKGSLAENEIEDLKKLAQLDTSYISQFYGHDEKIANEPEPTVNDLLDHRRNQRAQLLMQSFNQYSLK